MPEMSGTPARRIWSAFHKVMVGHKHLMSAVFAQHGIHPGQAMCLRHLSQMDGMTQRDLAERLHVSRPTVTVMLQKLERSGLIERRSDESDQRFTRIYLTEAGKELQERVSHSLDAAIESIVAPLSEKDQAETERLLALLGESLAKATQKAARSQSTKEEG